MPNEAELLAKQALEELEAEGETIEGKEPKVEEPKETQQEEPKAEEPKQPERDIKQVEAWKLKVAEDQKAKIEAEYQQKVSDLEAKVEELSKQRTNVTPEQKQEVADDLKELAEEYGVDENFIAKLQKSILSKVKPDENLAKTIEELKNEKELANQLAEYSNEFEKDIIPLVKEINPDIDATALSKLKTKLQDLAFSETYANVPLNKIFKAESDTLDIPVVKKSSEPTGNKPRANEFIDYDNMDEETFNSLTPEQVDEFTKRQTKGSGWTLRN